MGKKLKMDEVDTAQQRQIDALIVGFGMTGMIVIVWLMCLTFAIIK